MYSRVRFSSVTPSYKGTTMSGYYDKERVEHGGKPGDPLLRLDLDELYTDGYFYSEDLDICGGAHSQTILAKDREAFLNDFAAQFRAKVAEFLKPYDDTEDEE